MVDRRGLALTIGLAIATASAGNMAAAQTARRPAAPAAVPDGTYACQMWMGSSYVNLGKVRSVRGKLTPNPLAKVGATITGTTATRDGITIAYTTQRGYAETLDCKRG